MPRYIVRKLLLLIPLLLGLTIILFLILQLTPGDPAQVVLGDSATPENVAKLRQMWGLDAPLYVQIVRFIFNALQGDLGQSYVTYRPVLEDIATFFPATLELTFAGLLVATLIGVPAGIVSAVKRYSIFDNVSMLVALFGLSMPVFWTGLLGIYLFAFVLKWVPTSGRGGLDHLILPAVTLGLPSAAELARMTRSTVLDTLGTDYLRTARAKGLPEKLVFIRHAFRNALIPLVTVLGLRVGLLLSGAVVTETVFAWPGLGRLLLKAVLARDYPLIRGSVLFIAAIFVFTNLIVDVTYVYLDPRIRYK